MEVKHTPTAQQPTIKRPFHFGGDLTDGLTLMWELVRTLSGRLWPLAALLFNSIALSIFITIIPHHAMKGSSLLLIILNLWLIYGKVFRSVSPSHVSVYHTRRPSHQRHADAGVRSWKRIPAILALTKDDSQDSFVDASLGSHSGDMREKRSGLEVVADPVYELLTKYQNRILHVQSPICDLHELYLCGTIHIAQKSIDMVQEAMAVLKPHCVMVEMCEERIDGLVESDERQVNISLSHIFTSALQQRSFKSLGIGLLTWLQIKAASFVGSKLGGEIVFAAKAAHESGAWLVLGDRKYSVTIQRVFEHMPMREKIKLGFSLMIEMILLSFTKVKDYLQRTHEDQDFIADELESFSKSLPNFSKVIIHERDEYLAQSILEISRYIQLIDNKKLHLPSRKRILAVVGHGHLPGIQRILTQGGMPLERLHEISSSKHISSTWPGSGRFFMVNTHLLFNKTSDSIAFS